MACPAVTWRGCISPPVFSQETLSAPPHTIISLPVHTAVCDSLASGALVMLVAVQLSLIGLYLAPVFVFCPESSLPPHTIISLPVHTVVSQCSALRRIGDADGCPTICARIISQAGVVIPSAPNDHFAAGPHCRCPDRASGKTEMAVAVHVSSTQLPVPSAIFGSV